MASALEDAVGDEGLGDGNIAAEIRCQQSVETRWNGFHVHRRGSDDEQRPDARIDLVEMQGDKTDFGGPACGATDWEPNELRVAAEADRGAEATSELDCDLRTPACSRRSADGTARLA